MALYQDGILISGANTLPKMTLAEYNALPADKRPTYWERLDADYDDVLAPKTDIATVESGTTASRAYSVGELVYVSGTLYRVKTAIASGATFTVGTNVEVTSISEQIDSLKSYESIYSLNADDGFQLTNLTQYDELFIRFRDNNNGMYTQAHFYVPLLVTGDNYQNRFIISLNDAPAFGYLTLTSSHFKVYVPLATAKINIYGKKIK